LSADSSNVLSVDSTFFIELGIFIFIILFLNKFLFQPLLNLKENRDIETSVRIERAKSMDLDAANIEEEYKKRISDFKIEIEKASNEKLLDAKKQAELVIKKAKEESLIAIEDARKNLDSDLVSSISDMQINDIKINQDEVSKKVREISNLIKEKVS
jgi:F-type H+-transporting ATPase subunit b